MAGRCACTEADATTVVAQAGKVAAGQNGASDTGAAADVGVVVIAQLAGGPKDLWRRIGIHGDGVWVDARSAASHVALDGALNHDHTIACREHWKAHAGTQYTADQQEAQ